MTQSGYVYVDVRSPQEFEGGHPEGAYNIPFALQSAGGMQPNPDFMRVFEGVFPKDAKVVLGCMSGNRSARAGVMLEQAGYNALVEQRAGWGGVRDPFGRVSEPGWVAAGLPQATGPDGERGYAALKK